MTSSTDAAHRAAASEPRRICMMINTSFAFRTLCKGLVPFLERHGYEVHAILGDSEFTEFPEDQFGKVVIHHVNADRALRPVRDAVALLKVMRIFLKHRFDIVHISTPKSIVLGNLAAIMTLSGPRVMVYRRRIYELFPPREQAKYIAFDRAMARMCRFIVPISRRIGQQLLADGVCGADKIRFAGGGSSNGLDTTRFQRTAAIEAEAKAIRDRFAIPRDAPTLVYVGRLTSEKGVGELPEVFRQVLERVPGAHLIVVGPEDTRDPPPVEAMAFLDTHPQVHRQGFADDPRPYFAAADVFVFPSYFEGFGNVLLEAAALAVPSVAFDVSGINEAVGHGESGFLVPFRDVDAMAAAAIELLTDDTLRARMSASARARTVRLYDQNVIWNGYLEIFDEMLTAPRSGARPAPVDAERLSS
jgi:glycosyltransferase involved in cell wall biosynthesis